MITTVELDKIKALGESLQIEFAALPKDEKASLRGENLIGQLTGVRRVMEILSWWLTQQNESLKSPRLTIQRVRDVPTNSKQTRLESQSVTLHKSTVRSAVS